MSTTKLTKQAASTPDLDAATIAQLRSLMKSRERSARALRKRRRHKSGQ